LNAQYFISLPTAKLIQAEFENLGNHGKCTTPDRPTFKICLEMIGTEVLYILVARRKIFHESGLDEKLLVASVWFENLNI
jgi:hypothetical protein